jgi:hypothetical protein
MMILEAETGGRPARSSSAATEATAETVSISIPVPAVGVGGLARLHADGFHSAAAFIAMADRTSGGRCTSLSGR